MIVIGIDDVVFCVVVGYFGVIWQLVYFFSFFNFVGLLDVGDMVILYCRDGVFYLLFVIFVFFFVVYNVFVGIKYIFIFVIQMFYFVIYVSKVEIGVLFEVFYSYVL